jgi:uncharacterized protein YgfB (UPF0149 family)
MTHIPNSEWKNAFHSDEETQDDQGKDGGTNTHEHVTSLKRLILCAVDDDKKKIDHNSSITVLVNFVKIGLLVALLKEHIAKMVIPKPILYYKKLK